MATVNLKEYITDDYCNIHGAIKGPWIFERLDNAGVIWIIDNIISQQSGISMVTIDTDISFKKPIYRYGYVEVFVKPVTISRSRIKLKAEMYYVGREYKNKKILACTSTISFAFLEVGTRKIAKLRKEITDKLYT